MDATGRFSLVLSSYDRLLRKVLTDRFLFLAFLLAASLHAIGHGITAVIAGLLGRALVADTRLISSTFRFLSNPATLAFVGVGATVLKGAGATLGATAQSRLAQKVSDAVRQRMATRLLEGGAAVAPGHLSARLTVLVREVEHGVEAGVLGGVRAILALVPLMLALVTLSSGLALFALAVLVPFGCGVAFARHAWRRSNAVWLGVAEGLEREMGELVSQMDVWRTYGAGERIHRSLELLGDEAARASARAESGRAALSSANEVLAAIALLVCIVVAHRFAVPLGDGTLIAFAVVFFMAYRPLRDLGDARSALERGAHALSALELLPNAAASTPTPKAVHAWPRASLVVRGVGVDRRATGDASASRGPAPATSFVARPGETVAIVGATGSGKTTLLRALLGLESATFGSVRYGSLELSARGVGPAQRPFAWVPQDSPILAGSLDDNVTMGRPDRARVSAALELVGASALARDWQGERLGATGRPVSGGERKWIAMARAIATGLPVLLLDEPTAGLDVAARAGVLRALDTLRRDHTMVVVSHDEEVIRAADRVVRVGSEDLHEYVHV
jgi:ABC-type multidrug transport system fused ATPase/permease subunit